VRELDDNVDEHNYAKEPLKKKDVETILDAVGSIALVLNSRHAVAKERGWKEKPPSRAEFIRAALADANVLRRPIVVHGDRAVVGNDTAAVRELLGE
jgi:arsenate reductase-like glutaredoxin family protein